MEGRSLSGGHLALERVSADNLARTGTSRRRSHPSAERRNRGIGGVQPPLFPNLSNCGIDRLHPALRVFHLRLPEHLSDLPVAERLALTAKGLVFVQLYAIHKYCAREVVRIGATAVAWHTRTAKTRKAPPVSSPTSSAFYLRRGVRLVRPITIHQMLFLLACAGCACVGACLGGYAGIALFFYRECGETHARLDRIDHDLDAIAAVVQP